MKGEWLKELQRRRRESWSDLKNWAEEQEEEESFGDSKGEQERRKTTGEEKLESREKEKRHECQDEGPDGKEPKN